MLDKPLEYPPSVVENQEYPFDWYWEISVCEFPVYGISQCPSTFSEHALSPVSFSTHKGNRRLGYQCITYLGIIEGVNKLVQHNCYKSIKNVDNTIGTINKDKNGKYPFRGSSI